MFHYLEELSPKEGEELKRTIWELFRQTCILQVKCDPVTLVRKDNPKYQICNKHRDFISEYLEVLGCELYHDPQEHVFMIRGEDMPTEHISLLTTKLFLLIKLIYRDKILGEGLHATVTNLAEIRQYGSDTGLLKRKLTIQEWQEALSFMKIHQIIEYPGALRNMMDDTPIYIYSTVNLLFRANDIKEIIAQYIDDGQEDTFDGTAKETIDENLSE